MSNRLRLYKKGTRVRAKARTICGWKGTGTVVAVYNGLINVLPDGMEDERYNYCMFCAFELAVMRDQSIPHGG